MKEQIINYVSNHPNTRRRNIASALNIWLCDRTFLNAMNELIEDGILIEGEYRDMANMENYLTYTVKRG